MRIGIIGSRKRNSENDFAILCQQFNEVYQDGNIIVSGGCHVGGDYFAEIIAEFQHVPITIHLPDKSKLNEDLMEINPRVAYAKICYERNTLIANDSDVIIALVAPERKGGTEDTIGKFCKKHNKTENELIKEGKLFLL